MKVHFTADYDHRWPSRAISAFKSGTTVTVKREVGLAAIGKGKATEIVRHATPISDAITNDGRADSLVGNDTRPPDAERARGIRGRNRGSGDGDGSPDARDKLAGHAQ